MLQEVQQYTTTIEFVNNTYGQDSEAHTAMRDAAWRTLGTSEDPLVRFIVENAGEYRTEALVALRALPTDLAGIRAAMQGAGYDTAVFQGLVRAAVAAGVLTEETTQGTTPATGTTTQRGAARTRFLERVSSTLGSHAVREAEELLNAVVAEESGR